ncbi:tyrosinase central domain protein [Aspergillus sclerotiicarbonarius CBS 121057]|uniref:Tyrosinase central domain protein n=1 Tax=Aspergillus sclerotiicarbonarius (strain CBS 121057 / IBT 28362) TaxID=1448318 RepID=A0A319FE23_ASPSB|nr:tyrosinase central domain protein [Aspergillus sclerotiicarbonarius CBS 121057]
MRSWISLLLPVLAAAGAIQQCKPSQARTRKEWGVLSTQEKTEYIDAVWCLRGLPSVLPNGEYPGVRDRMDDFVATHINYTLYIHSDGLLLPWHRHFIYLYEKALQDECNYKGTLPYWNWTLSTDNSTLNPVFDGSSTSFSGNGLPIDKTNATALCPKNIPCPTPGTGGGCLYNGPFINWTSHLGPFSISQVQPYGDLPPNTWAYNPRCLTRDFTPDWLSSLNTPSKISSMLSAPDIKSFLSLMSPSTLGYVGAHEGGHAAIGANMLDTFASVQDPVFFLHHGMVDRVWTLWQQGDPESRLLALNGTGIVHDPPTAELVTLDTMMEFGVLDCPVRVGDVMDVLEGEYCYKYD